ncbi:hypothetical protein WR25_11957 [Diploscapter pachys]|uniref:Uncharacterized protein n=1 Tax=Diploscapter pachys TaxID=2018661 RepID=A0A2A2LKL4_9BILA|nr:hypothetical protein WR25_11957 [Diploscapter pachys]
MANSEDQRHHSEIPSTARINEPPPTYEEAVNDIPSQYPRLFDAFNEALQSPNEAPKPDDQNDEHLKRKDKDNDIIKPEELSVDRLPSSPPPLYPPNYLESNPSNLTTTSYVHPPSYSEFADETTTIESSNAYRFEHWQSAQFNRPR